MNHEHRMEFPTHGCKLKKVLRLLAKHKSMFGAGKTTAQVVNDVKKTTNGMSVAEIWKLKDPKIP